MSRHQNHNHSTTTQDGNQGKEEPEMSNATTTTTATPVGQNVNENSSSTTTLASLAHKTQVLLKETPLNRLEQVPYDIHPLPPLIPKAHWMELAAALQQAENPTTSTGSISGDRWISLRCDGTGFSKGTKVWKRQGLLEPGWSPRMAEIMRTCCQGLMEKYAAVCGYTHSDELTILIPPTNPSKIQGEYFPHPYNGRIQKLCSLSAAFVTAQFNHELQRLLLRKRQQEQRQTGQEQHNEPKGTTDSNAPNATVEEDETGTVHQEEEEDEDTLDCLATFDCRVGSYATQAEALSLILWRTYDCGVNGVTDAIYSRKGQIEGAGRIVKLGAKQKIEWLYQHHQLPLDPHQRDGAYFVRRKRCVTALNRQTQQPVQCLRSKTERIQGNVHLLFRNDQLFPPDEKLPRTTTTTKK